MIEKFSLTDHRLLAISFSIGSCACFYGSLAQTVNDDVSTLLACSSEKDPMTRLSCFDLAASELRTARDSGNVLIISKEEIEQAEAEAFGLNTSVRENFDALMERRSVTSPPNTSTALPVKEATLPGREVIQRKESSQAKTTSETGQKNSDSATFEIAKVETFGYGRKRLFLTNGQIWAQTTSNELRVPKVRSGRAANTVKISRTLGGGFMLRVNDKGRAVRVKRVR